MQKMHGLKPYYYFFSFLFIVASCRDKSSAPAISFYYWKTNFELNKFEKNVLAENNVQSLYIRYFDVDTDAGNGQPKPISTVSFAPSFPSKAIIPVVYIKNRVFENADSSIIYTLCKNILRLITGINEKNKISITEVQFDCDWTEKTKDKFFFFLKEYRKLSGLTLSATIRLHQVKYTHLTGIPPVDYGVLMFYNMGSISAGDVNSIYEEKNALKYVSSLKRYPLSIDIALPVFSWGIGTRDGKVHYLLNKMYIKDFEKDSNFTVISPGRFKAKHSFFKSGYYILENDQIKIENIGKDDLNQMTDLLNKNISQRVKKVIFYDLDSSNFINYESRIFQKVSQRLR